MSYDKRIIVSLIRHNTSCFTTTMQWRNLPTFMNTMIQKIAKNTNEKEEKVAIVLKKSYRSVRFRFRDMFV